MFVSLGKLNEEVVMKSSTCRFLLQFTTNGTSLHSNGQLDIVETNPFKHLIHLSLKFLPGNDDEIKKYLASCIKSLKVCFKFYFNFILHLMIQHPNFECSNLTILNYIIIINSTITFIANLSV